ncbi:OmpP1/FadL family transporter [Thauera sp. Sel9]|uniref:OmpP1/FadL family transporter n=1 Tax=Thauera sp. Sel9 TaxID=2974299 RepID=UPI0021E193B8|nr:outer membrane protein transport protein [Thauera sp. Sel9]MCV2217966.1 outer membrane protein transport protein [Thauera sp. Sel9]
MKHIEASSLALLIAGALHCGTATATQGIFPHGYGVRSEGMGGVGVALPQDAVAGATNPAGMVAVGDRLDLGLALLKVDNGVRFAGVRHSGSKDTSLYVIPQFGYNHMIDSASSVGVSVIGNGVGTNYGSSDNVGGMASPRSALQQMVITLSYARRVGNAHALGFGVVVARQDLDIDGPASIGLPEGRDKSWGAGLRVGWQGTLAPGLTAGATYASKVNMGRMDKFAGLLPEKGDMDIPANYGLGLAWTQGALTLGADVLRILWRDVRAYGNGGVGSSTGAPGSDHGPGFGWKNQTVWRIGAAYTLDAAWTLRAGYNHGSRLLDSRHTYLGALAPAANRRHLTMGASHMLGNGDELSVAYTRSFSETTHGTGNGPDGMTDPYMGQHWLSVSYGLRF